MLKTAPTCATNPSPAPVPVCASLPAWATPVEGRRCAAGRPGSLSLGTADAGQPLASPLGQMFQHAGLELPVSLAETNLQVLVRVLMMQTDALHVMPLEVAQVFRARCRQAIVPARLPRHMDSFGLITRSGHLLARRAPPAPRARWRPRSTPSRPPPLTPPPAARQRQLLPLASH